MTRNPGVNPGNETRIRQLEATVRHLTLSQNNMLEMLRRHQRFGGGGTTALKCDVLQPGIYQAFTGDEIGPRELGPIRVNICEAGPFLSLPAINATDCRYYPGQAIAAFVDPCCRVFFTGCGGIAAATCCEKTAFVCVDGQTWGIRLGGPPATFYPPFNPLCDPPIDALVIELLCTGETVTANLAFYWTPPGGPPGSGVYETTLDWSGLCADPPTAYDDTITVPGPDCDIEIKASTDMGVCIDPTPPTGSCCEKLLWLCLNNERVQLAVNGGSHTWNVADCVNCVGAQVQVQLTCNNGIITLQWFYTCGSDTEFFTVNISQFCRSNDPLVIPIATMDGFMQLIVTIIDQECFDCLPTVDTACCSGVPETLEMVIVGGAFAGTYSMTYAAGEWGNTTGAFTARLTCESGPAWQMTLDFDTYGTSAATCDPFSLSLDVTGNSHSITSITITKP